MELTFFDSFFVITLDNRWKRRKPENNFDNDEYCCLYESTQYLHETIDMKQFQPVVVNYRSKRNNSSSSKPTNVRRKLLKSLISGKEAGRTIHWSIISKQIKMSRVIPKIRPMDGKWRLIEYYRSTGEASLTFCCFVSHLSLFFLLVSSLFCLIHC